MASSLMHLAVTKRLAEEKHIEKPERLLFGAILPDGATRGNAHLKKITGDKKTLELSYFREHYGIAMREDALYMGYYLHLVQDICFRRFVYGKYAWNPKPEGNVEKLHNDYALLNPYLVEKYGLRKDMIAECAIDLDFASFDTKALAEEVRAQFDRIPTGETFFFTRAMADAFIEEAYRFCHAEMEHPAMDENEYAWDRHA